MVFYHRLTPNELLRKKYRVWARRARPVLLQPLLPTRLTSHSSVNVLSCVPRGLSFCPVLQVALRFLWLGVSLTRPPFAFQFFVFLLVIFALEIAAAVWGYSHKDEVGIFCKISWPCSAVGLEVWEGG